MRKKILYLLGIFHLSLTKLFFIHKNMKNFENVQGNAMYFSPGEEKSATFELFGREIGHYSTVS